ncbi:histidine ammonia-lyase (plasmid) [Deinococcus metallilatus]|uniref:Histidine ammonia-lyase n=1 Tax=Deinococcus metallilatus TaxID=1211322 RepID=A0AAJ5FBY1_9DEIO|nr:histidine ammonia-lyase [Deinococcus metallilatus]MBB5293286.1 histidine ammonia-lyase [Deinococcus metallilatus]QBY06398.1 histidine ammonia-lyase [Deinococcus metallilatus]RXJ18077.1 histidine ammonia-lyase [Deinococcus metallilatus]TLK32013.1 histidine ammonia-lyase [Deinococcus metallilatus]GMA15491.1 histidine ammonia-lyase [Deinococcus metallilatus]
MILDRQLTLDDFIRVVRGGEPVELSEAARERILTARAVVERIVDGPEAVYGVNTGFGKFASVRIARDELARLQHNLIVSHAIGVGEPLPAEVVRGMLLLRAQSLALGHSGVRPEVVELLLALLNAGAHPVVPAQGSVGASGDLAPLAHLALALIGLGEIESGGEVRPAGEVLAELNLQPLTLEAKEGLALINGTQLMGSLLALCLHDARTLLHTANLAAAMTVEALSGSHRPFAEGVVHLRPHPGAVEVAAELRHFLRDSAIAPAHANCGKVQDAYSLRAVPQVHGATLDALMQAGRVLNVEFASVTDNPLIFPDTGEVISGGNFHGQPLALTADALKVAVAELANISERRTEQLLNPALSGLPGFLAREGGLNSGYMIAQYTAAALVSENKVLAHPASVDSIPTSANQEDHVSMGAHGARQLRQILGNAQNVLSIELMCAAQALDFQPLRAGRGVQAAYEGIRQIVPPLDRDRYYRPDLLALRGAVVSGDLLRLARDA